MAKTTAHKTLGTTEYEVVGDDLDDVEDEIARIERNYHPVGYGTSFHKPEQRADGSWIARGHRFNSCD